MSKKPDFEERECRRCFAPFQCSTRYRFKDHAPRLCPKCDLIRLYQADVVHEYKNPEREFEIRGMRALVGEVTDLRAEVADQREEAQDLQALVLDRERQFEELRAAVEAALQQRPESAELLDGIRARDRLAQLYRENVELRRECQQAHRHAIEFVTTGLLAQFQRDERLAPILEALEGLRVAPTEPAPSLPEGMEGRDFVLARRVAGQWLYKDRDGSVWAKGAGGLQRLSRKTALLFFERKLE